VVVLSLLGQLAAIPAPAAAQLVPPNRSALSFSAATFAPAVYSLSFSSPITPVWDFTLSYSWQTIGATTGSLLAAGGRYHFPLTGSPVRPFVGGGFASVGATIPGFGAVSASGLYVSIGASVPLAAQVTGYGSASYFSTGGASNNVLDLGVQFRLAPTASAQVGYINFSGSSAPYLGVTFHLP